MADVNKKTSRIFKSVIVSAILLALMLAALAGCSGDTENSSVAEVGTSSNAESASVSEIGSEAENSATVSENLSESESTGSSGDESDEASDTSFEESNEESFPEDESSESGDESIEPEILGTGTKSDPFLMIPTEEKTVATYAIPAGESHYYSIYRVGGTVLTIENENAYVEYDGIPFIAKNGKVTVEIAYALASEAILFKISNEGENEETFLLQFENPVGTMANPKKVENVSKDNSVSIPAGVETGYHFSYIAEKDGVLRFYKTSSVASVLSVTNNSNSANRTSEETEEEYVELEVKAGDEIIIVVGAQRDKRNNIPAVDITWNAIYA